MARRGEQPVRDADDAGEARRLALKMLKGRMVSRGVLVMRLVKRGVSPEAAGAVATQLEGLGLLDDRKLAASLVRKQMGMKAAGKRVLVAKLRQRGIGTGTATEAVDEGLKGRDPLADAIDLARRRMRTMKQGLDSQVVRQRVFAYLARRGFDAEVCRTAVERAFGKMGDLPAD